VQTESPGFVEQIAALTTELEQTTSRIASLELELNVASMEIASLKSALDKQRLMAKLLWRENCKLQLKYEDEIDSKDRKIQSFKAHLHRPLQTPTLRSI